MRYSEIWGDGGRSRTWPVRLLMRFANSFRESEPVLSASYSVKA